MAKRLAGWLVGFFVFVQGVATIWPTVSKDTLPEWLARQTWLTVSGATYFGYASLLIGLGLIVLMGLERWRPRPRSENTFPIEIGSREHKRHLLATYFMHALVCKAAIVGDLSASDSKLGELESRLNKMRRELVNSQDVLSHDTSLEFTEPNYTSTNSRDRVLQNADHFMERAHHKWKAWGGQTATTPLASRTASPSLPSGA